MNKNDQIKCTLIQQYILDTGLTLRANFFQLVCDKEMHKQTNKMKEA